MSSLEAFPDRPVPLPFEADVNGKKMLLGLGNCAIALFRHRPNMDYLAVLQGGGDEESWVFCFDQQPLIHWMGGVALNASDREDIRRADSKLGSFYSRYQWNPDVIINDYPNANELAVYVDYITNGFSIPDTLEGLDDN